MFKRSNLIAALYAVAAIPALLNAPAIQAQEGASEYIEEVVTTGTRRKERSAADTPAPVDVITGEEFRDQATSDISDMIRTVVPSYNVNTQPISDAATLIRPANLRGLSPDHTLVLLNGKRRHRASIITFLGGGIADGAHGPDIGVIPAIGLKRVEVLRDGASSQYGSDAIAGVMNFVLRDDREGMSFETKWGSTFEGDGDNYRVAANIGLPVGSEGFLNLSAEFGETDDTIRSVQRADAAALIAAGNTAVASKSVNTITSDVVQIWGQPKIEEDTKFFYNFGIPVTNNIEVYSFGNYASRTVDGGFFFRNPTNRGGVFTGPTLDKDTFEVAEKGEMENDEDFSKRTVGSIRVGDLSVNNKGDCPAGIPLNQKDGLIPDPAVLAEVIADDNCFSFVERFPGGFVPRFGGDLEDRAVALGVRGEFANGLGYDVSYTYGWNQAEFFIYNTINASLGPDTPTHFNPGTYIQTDNNFNIDMYYALPVDAFASDLSIAFGFEARSEEFEIKAGDPASREIGILSRPTGPEGAYPEGQGFSSSSNGFGGFTVSQTDEEKNNALYVELEADLTSIFTMQAAARYEDFDTFGSTFDHKIGALIKASEQVSFRGTYSTGFHVPTAGQANVVNVSTVFVGLALADRGTIPITSGAGQFVNSRREQRGEQAFELGPEEATNLALGMALTFDDLSITLDYFQIEVEGRIATTSDIDFVKELRDFGTANGVDTSDLMETSQIINRLHGTGGFDRTQFAGSEDLLTFNVFTNNFDTETKGLDIVASHPLSLGPLDGTVALALNYTDTEVSNIGTSAPLDRFRVRQIEENIPHWKGNASYRFSVNRWDGMFRVNYHSGYFEDHLDSAGAFGLEPDAEVTVDVEATYRFGDSLDGLVLTLGAANVFDSYPDLNEHRYVVGSKYPATAPFGYNGGQYYLRLRYER